MIPLDIDLEHIERIQDTCSYWHRPMHQPGKCPVCDIRRACQRKTAWRCPHTDKKAWALGKCKACDMRDRRRRDPQTLTRQYARFQQRLEDPQYYHDYLERRRLARRARVQDETYREWLRTYMRQWRERRRRDTARANDYAG